MSVRSRRGARRPLPPEFAARMWRPGQSGNPSGHSGLYGETLRLARRAAPDAIRRLIELMSSDDERVAAVACNAILDRAFGKPREYDPATETGNLKIDAVSLTTAERARLRDALTVVLQAAGALPLPGKAGADDGDP
jgi:hypothetical protein